MDAPLLDQNARFIQAVEQFAIQELVSEFSVETFTVTVLPRAPGFYIRSLGAVPARIVWTRFCNSGRLSDGIRLTGFEG